MTWRKVTLGDVIALQRGYYLPTHKRIPGTVPVIGSAGLTGWHNEVRVRAPGVVVGRAGASAGAVNFVTKDFWPHNATLYVKDFKSNDPWFVAQLLKTLPFDDFNSGSAQQMLNRNYAYQLPVLLPDLSTQRRIASILFAYDDLIEVNRRRVAILEEMARRLFEEWFVHLRFPSHETIPVYDTPDGPLPERWQRAALSTLTSYVNRGIAPRYDETSDTLVASQRCVRDGRFSLERARRQSKPVPREKLVQLGDILINSTGAGTLGRVAQVEIALPGLTVDTHVTIVRPKIRQDSDFLGSTLIRLQPEFERLGTGSTNQTELNRSTIAAMPILIPPSSLRERFGMVIRPSRELIATLSEQTIRLAAARDLLLPRLISGELSTAEALAPERFLEAAD